MAYTRSCHRTGLGIGSRTRAGHRRNGEAPPTNITTFLAFWLRKEERDTDVINVTTTAIVVAATCALGVLRLLLTLLFLWKVYTRGGRQDLTAAARALRDA
ncbi:hypothetical protein [Amycolatopsis sp. lyj-23]|uniref:hypothetical protein n=1 Tax=Amycolatopsis sp. lyj-23 TaxID=2789283 RepID=UPI00397870AF